MSASMASVMKLWSHQMRRTSLLPICAKFSTSSRQSQQATVADVDNFPVKSLDDIPGPLSLPLIKTAWIFFPIFGNLNYKKIHKGHRILHDKYGKLIRFDMPNRKMILVLDPNDISAIFSNEGKYPRRPGLEPLGLYRESRPDLYKSGGITVVQGEQWHRIRSNIQPYMLRPKLVQQYISGMDEVANDVLKNIRLVMAEGRETKDFIDDLHAWAIESIALVTLNKRLGCIQHSPDESTESRRMMNAALGIIRGLDKTVFGIPLWMYIPTPGWKLLTKSHEYFGKIALKYINEAMEKAKAKSEDEDQNLLEIFLTKKALHPKEVVLMAIDMFIGGIDTTSNTAGFTLYNLAKNQDKQDKLFEELRQALPTPDSKFTKQTLQDIPYLRSCIKETLRLCPVVLGTARVLDKEIILSGYRIPSGVQLIPGTMTSAGLEEHFPNATSYEPERWMDRSKSGGLHPFAYLPFGHGPRSCIGRRLAEQELHILMAKIFRNFKVEYHHEPLDMFTGLTNRPDKPLRFKFVERE